MLNVLILLILSGPSIEPDWDVIISDTPHYFYIYMLQSNCHQ